MIVPNSLSKVYSGVISLTSASKSRSCFPDEQVLPSGTRLGVCFPCFPRNKESLQFSPIKEAMSFYFENHIRGPTVGSLIIAHAFVSQHSKVTNSSGICSLP